MSRADRTTLSEFLDEDADTADEAQPAWTPTATDSDCLNCGAHVDSKLQRVFGDNEDRVHRCPECAPFQDLAYGASQTDRAESYLQRGSLR